MLLVLLAQLEPQEPMGLMVQTVRLAHKGSKVRLARLVLQVRQVRLVLQVRQVLLVRQEQLEPQVALVRR